jgi:hypothetical protein
MDGLTPRQEYVERMDENRARRFLGGFREETE